MPRKSKKSTEIQAVEPDNATDLTKESTETALDGEVEPRTPQQNPAAQADETAEAEATAHAADTFDDAFEERNPAGSSQPVKGTSEIPEVTTEDDSESEETEDEEERFDRPPAKLERLQKILAQAGIASRRHAEELITEGRVQVNGKVVTELGSKADPARDHIRVDGKLLQGAERLRYFMLNKPRGHVTTVSDPEGRPTVMEFFSKMGERLYPVGRLDFQSEGLLLVTNDGELANKLTRAASGVEKTYLVKVSGYPSEEQLDSLREGVSIDRGKPGEGRVRTAPASIRMIRSGENPWFEVVLIEGRNRELRKMFEEIGHHVEKIRRVGYGPLVLDVEPGKMRELEPEELELLRKAAEGKWKPKRIKTSAMLPKEAGRSVDLEAGKNRRGKPFRSRTDREEGQRRGPQARTVGRGREEQERAPRRSFGGAERPSYGRQEDRAGNRRPSEAGGERRGFGRAQSGEQRGERRGVNRPPQGEDRGQRRTTGRTYEGRDQGGARRFGARPESGYAARGGARGDERRPFRGSEGSGGEEARRSGAKRGLPAGGQRPFRGREESGGEGTQRFGAQRGAPRSGQRPFRGRPQGEEQQERPRFDRGAAGQRPRRLEIVEEGAETRESRPSRPRREQGGFQERPSRPRREGGTFQERPSRPRAEDRGPQERPARRPAGRGFSQDRSKSFGERGQRSGGGFESGRRSEQRTGDRPRREEGARPERSGSARGFGGGRPGAGGRSRSSAPGRGGSGGGSRPGSRGGGARGGQGRPNRGGSRPGGGRRG